MTVGEMRKKLEEFPDDMVACRDGPAGWVECSADDIAVSTSKHYYDGDWAEQVGEFLRIG